MKRGQRIQESFVRSCSASFSALRASFLARLASFCSATCSLAPAYDVVTSCLPPVQPNTRTTVMTAKRTFQAVVISCWAVEYATAVLLGTLQHVLSASAFVACVIPTAPGVTDTTLASDPDPITHVIESNVTGMANA